MLPKFANREREMRFLEETYREKGFNLVVLYGRRRVGKTELIKKFIENKPSIYILATDESFAENIKSFKQKFAEFAKKEYFLRLETKSLYELFRFFCEEINEKKCVMVIDEFPYLMQTKKGLLSLFQKIIDELLMHTNVILILCGSSMSVMESELLGKGTPLYGRKLNIWKLQPFSFKHVVKYFKNPFEVYFIFGGVPYYLKFYNEDKSLTENIREILLTKGKNLYDEPLILLRQEFRESRVYRLVLKYLSLGYKTIGKLCSASGMDKSNLTKYLSSLEEVGIVRHILPFGMKRKGIYEINDPLFRFWFKFVYPYRDYLEVGRREVVEEIIARELNEYFGLCFEYLVEEILKEKLIPEFENFGLISKWWYEDKEIDIVALNEKAKEILFAECKWQEKVNAKKICKELAEKSRYVQWHNDKRKEGFAIFAKSFSRRINEFEGRKVYCFDLRDMKRVVKEAYDYGKRGRTKTVN